MKKTIAALILAFTTLSIHADSFPLYIGAGTGLARYVGENVKDPIYLPDQKTEDDISFNEAYVGIDLGDYFAVELAYAQFDQAKDRFKIDPDVNFIVDPNDRTKVDFDRLSIMGVAEYPLTGGFSIYATGGYAYYDFTQFFYADSSSTKQNLLKAITDGDHGLEYGFGVKWEFISRFSVVGQWSKSIIGGRDVQSNRLSVQFHF